MRVTADAARQVRSGHPWVFDRSITVAPDEAEAGTLAVVFDPRREFAGIGLWDPTSPIRVKVLQHSTTRTIDGSFWAERISAALARRQSLHESGHTTMYRCVHGEGDGLPGLVLDRYGHTFVLKVYSLAWAPHLDEVVRAAVEAVTPLVGSAVPNLLLRTARSVAGDGRLVEGKVLSGSTPAGPLRCLEHGLTMEVDVVRGHKTGHFLDQRDNRQLVRTLAHGKRVLDVFCATGGFSVCAAAGGARSVLGVDVSGPALATARRNMELNRHLAEVRHCHHHTTAGDAFHVLTELATRREQFDLVILDPPSFASSASQVPAALQAYRRLTSLGLRVLAPGGMLLQASCTARVSVDDLSAQMHAAAGRSGRRLHELRRTGQPIDHPVRIPETAYLKAILAEVG